MSERKWSDVGYDSYLHVSSFIIVRLFFPRNRKEIAVISLRLVSFLCHSPIRKVKVNDGWGCGHSLRCWVERKRWWGKETPHPHLSFGDLLRAEPSAAARRKWYGDGSGEDTGQEPDHVTASNRKKIISDDCHHVLPLHTLRGSVYASLHYGWSRPSFSLTPRPPAGRGKRDETGRETSYRAKIEKERRRKRMMSLSTLRSFSLFTPFGSRIRYAFNCSLPVVTRSRCAAYVRVRRASSVNKGAKRPDPCHPSFSVFAFHSVLASLASQTTPGSVPLHFVPCRTGSATRRQREQSLSSWHLWAPFVPHTASREKIEREGSPKVGKERRLTPIISKSDRICQLIRIICEIYNKNNRC